jgi:hypothetical protein
VCFLQELFGILVTSAGLGVLVWLRFMCLACFVFFPLSVPFHLFLWCGSC